MSVALSSPIYKRPLLFGLAAFLFVLILTQYLSFLRYSIAEENERSLIIQESNSVKDRLKTTLASSLSATKTLAFIVENYGVSRNFDILAQEILNSNKNIDALQLTRKGTITHVYPLEGNEKAIGFDILKDKLTRREANTAIKKRELFFAGPLELRQGGRGIVGRLPIFVNSQFWGFSVVIVKIPALLKAIGIDTIKNSKYHYQLSKINPNTGREEFFLASPVKFDRKNSVSIKVPDGEWNLYVIPKNSNNYYDAAFFSLIGFLTSAICGFLAWFIAIQPDKLNSLVKFKTQQLLDSQQDYKATLERVSDAFVSLNKNGYYTYMNKKASEIFTCDPEEMIGRHIWTEFSQRVGQPFYNAYHKAMAQQEYVYLEEYYAPYQMWIENHIYPSADGITIYFKDVTERKKAEQEILQGKKFADAIINSLPGVFYLYDKDGKFLQWNRNLETVSGYSGDEIKDMHPLDFFCLEDKELLKTKIGLVFTEGFADVEACILTKSGEMISYYLNGYTTTFDDVDYLMGLGIDITERNKIRNALKASEEKYRYLFNHNPALIIIWDPASLKILEVNDSALEQYGYTREEFLNLSVMEIRPKEEQPRMKDFADEMLADSSLKIRRIWPHLKKSGEIMFMDISSHPIDFENRKAVLALAIDITEQITAQNHLEETYSDIRRLNAHLQTIREEERISIAREIHDELGQQLTGLKMDAAWLAKKAVKEEAGLQDRVTGMLSLIDETVKTVRRISSDLRPAILDDLGLIAALECHSEEFEKRSGIHCDFSTTQNEFSFEKNLMTGIFRIYQETLTNIMRHARATTVSTEIEEHENYFLLRVTDNGLGFDVDEIKGKKTLGLAGMRERALMFGGKLEIESLKGHGSKVILTLPISQTGLEAP